MTLEQLTTRVDEIFEMSEVIGGIAISAWLLGLFALGIFCYCFYRIEKLEKAQKLSEEKEEKRLERKRVVDEIIDYFERTK